MPNGKTAASPSKCSAPAEIVEQQPRALEPADARRPRQYRSRARIAVACRVPLQTDLGTRAARLSVRVSRYATQALLVANVDEARYQVLLADDGKALVKARYAVRNNHRGLLSVSLPSGATLWHASVARRPVRPGRSPEGALLVPSLKARGNDESSLFAVEIVVRRTDSTVDRSRNDRHSVAGAGYPHLSDGRGGALLAAVSCEALRRCLSGRGLHRTAVRSTA